MTHYSERDLRAANALAIMLMCLGNIWLLWFIIMRSALCGGSRLPYSWWLGVLYFLLGAWLKWRVSRERRAHADESEHAE